jgi:hypothetical protein
MWNQDMIDSDAFEREHQDADRHSYQIMTVREFLARELSWMHHYQPYSPPHNLAPIIRLPSYA